LYLSGYLKRNQAEYYRLLSGTRADGNWEAWVSFFLAGVAESAAEAEANIVEVATLVTADRRRLLDAPKATSAAYRLFEMLPMMPRFTVERVRQNLGTSFPTANAAVKLLAELGIVVEVTGQRKNRTFSYQAYIRLLSRSE
jgi:Fic family protein